MLTLKAQQLRIRWKVARSKRDVGLKEAARG